METARGPAPCSADEPDRLVKALGGQRISTSKVSRTCRPRHRADRVPGPAAGRAAIPLGQGGEVRETASWLGRIGRRATMLATCGRAQMARFSAREGSLASGCLADSNGG